MCKGKLCVGREGERQDASGHITPSRINRPGELTVAHLTPYGSLTVTVSFPIQYYLPPSLRSDRNQINGNASCEAECATVQHIELAVYTEIDRTSPSRNADAERFHQGFHSWASVPLEPASQSLALNED